MGIFGIYITMEASEGLNINTFLRNVATFKQSVKYINK